LLTKTKIFAFRKDYSCEAVDTYLRILDNAFSLLANRRNSRPKGWLVPSITPPRRQLPHYLGAVAGDFGTNNRFSARQSSSFHYIVLWMTVQQQQQGILDLGLLLARVEL
jgi:hypothetical protein